MLADHLESSSNVFTFVAHELSLRLLATPSSPNPPHAVVPPPVYRKRGAVQSERVYMHPHLYIYIFFFFFIFVILSTLDSKLPLS